METPAVISLEQVAASYANAKGEYGKQNVYRYLQILIEGLSEWNIFNSVRKVNWYAGVVNAQGVVDWPSDMIDYIRIGVYVDGLVYTLTRNDNMDIPIGMECGQVTGVDAPTLFPIAEPLYWNWTTVDYASSGGHNFAYYRTDKENRRTVFKGDTVGRQVIIEYVSSGVSLSGETFVPAELMQYLKLYLNWQLKLYSDSKDTEYFAREFSIKKGEMKNFQWAFRPDEFLDMIRATFTRAIKR